MSEDPVLSLLAEDPSRPVHSTVRDIFATLWLALGFFSLYSGYNALQTLLPLQRPVDGPFTIALSYFAYSIAALLTPARTLLLRRLALSAAAVTFAGWIVSTQYSDLFLASMSVLNGAGAGILWSTEGGWLASQNPQHSGRISSTILAAFHLATIAGQLTAQFSSDNVTLIALISSCTAAILFLCTPNRWLGPAAEITARPPLSLLVASEWRNLIPAIITFGLASSLIWVYMPQRLMEEDMSWGFIVFAATSAILFLPFGALADRYDVTVMFRTAAIVHTCLWFFLAITSAGSGEPLLYMAIAALANTLLNQAIVQRQTQLGELASIAFAYQVSLYCLSYALGSTLIAYDFRITSGLLFGSAFLTLVFA